MELKQEQYERISECFSKQRKPAKISDLEALNAVTVSKSAGRINGEVKVTQPKTANSVRTIYPSKETVNLLIQEHTKHPDNPVMFPSPVTGRLYGPASQAPVEKGRYHRKYSVPRAASPKCQAQDTNFFLAK